MDVIDFHCDVLALAEDLLQSGKEYDFQKNQYHIDLEKLKRGNYLLQCFAVFVNAATTENPLRSALKQVDHFYRFMERYPDQIVPVTKFEEIQRNQEAGKINALLTIEDGGCFMDTPEVLRQFYRMGARIMTLTWNYRNGLASPNVIPEQEDDRKSKCFADSEHGLTPLGFEFLEEMERLGMIADVSHLSDAGFRDICRAAKRPFIASHSNARSVSSHVRNLTDDMLRALADHGGITGINYHPPFLDDAEFYTDSEGSFEWITRHISHIRKVAGIDVIALGSDFDGIIPNKALPDCSAVPALADHLFHHGFTSGEVEKIFRGNALRLLREFL